MQLSLPKIMDSLKLTSKLLRSSLLIFKIKKKFRINKKTKKQFLRYQIYIKSYLIFYN